MMEAMKSGSSGAGAVSGLATISSDGGMRSVVNGVGQLGLGPGDGNTAGSGGAGGGAGTGPSRRGLSGVAAKYGRRAGGNGGGGSSNDPRVPGGGNGNGNGGGLVDSLRRTNTQTDDMAQSDALIPWDGLTVNTLQRTLSVSLSKQNSRSIVEESEDDDDTHSSKQQQHEQHRAKTSDIVSQRLKEGSIVTP